MVKVTYESNGSRVADGIRITEVSGGGTIFKVMTGKTMDDMSTLKFVFDDEEVNPAPGPVPVPPPAPETGPVQAPPILGQNVVTTGPDLIAAIKAKAASGGEVVAQGDMGGVDISVAAMVPITVRCAGAKFDHLHLKGSRKITFFDGDVCPKVTTPDVPLLLADTACEGITFDGFEVRSHPDAHNYRQWTQQEWLARKAWGAKIAGRHCMLMNSRLLATHLGANLEGELSALINNQILGNSYDCIRFIGTTKTSFGMAVSDNFIADTYLYDPAAHTDFIQLWTVKNAAITAEMHNGLIAGNVMTIRATYQDGRDSQTSNMPVSNTQGIGVFDGIYQGLTVAGNILNTTHYIGLKAMPPGNASFSNSRVTDNLFFSPNRAGDRAQIMMGGPGLQHSGNRARIVNIDGVEDKTHGLTEAEIAALQPKFIVPSWR
ncbi:MAG: hypothetical protein WBB85_16135 [Albidovulum sp.]|uniref:hypothetical protein n=1 Tax=Albidovulum sp. TaxID=1872424 RepID=UPI003C8FAD03